jgi:hypothetical protein
MAAFESVCQERIMNSPIDQLTPREKLRDAAHLLRELAEHLEQGFVPKVHELKKLSRQQDPASDQPPVTDLTIRSSVAAVVESDRYSAGLTQNIEHYLISTQHDVSELLRRGEGKP